jgi:hypothetical protein
MKIRIEPSADQSKEAHPHVAVEVEVPQDDLTAGQVVELVRSALVACTFHPDCITEAMHNVE